LNLPEKTAERYKRDPFMDDGSVMFNTGDLGRWSGDGELEHLGRTDDQVKIKGFRVELDGVGAAMETHPEVKVAVAILIEKELWGFVTPANVNTEEVKAAATKVQPYYAVPTHYLAMDSFPHTANGKIDKRALKQLAAEKGTVSVAPPSLTVARAIPSGPFVFRPLSTASQETLVVPPKGELMPYKPSGLRSGESTAANSTIDLSSSLEKGNIWDGYKEDELPEKTQGKWIRNLRFQVFSLYRRLFSIVFISNMIALIVILSQGAEKRNAKRIGQIVVANIFSGVLMRQEYIVNGFFNFFTSVPRSWPIWIRRVCARVYAIGGLHSGFGVSGLIWLIVFTVQATREYVNKQQTSLATVIITYFILALLMTIVTFAYPTIRKKFHNKFEATHRFLGWTATGLVWAQVISLTNDYKPADQSLGQALVHSAPFWLVVVMTASIFLPWAHLKKVPVVPEVLSSHAVRLHFNYTTPRAGSFVRLSDKPLTEWHSFATISEPQKHGFSVVVSKAGDWTSKVIANPPREIWVRGIPTLGVLNILPMFRRVVLVATGSGIGPCTPAVLEQRIPIRLLWTAPSVRGTFGDKLVDSLLTANPDTVIYDTRKHGKPDMVKLTHRLVQEFNAEAVIIISNEKLTQKVVYGMMSRGIPAFGAIWDS
jgi:NAD(P)H-flavin reductase